MIWQIDIPDHSYFSTGRGRASNYLLLVQLLEGCGFENLAGTATLFSYDYNYSVCDPFMAIDSFDFLLFVM